MQIILVSRHLAQARTLTIMPRHIAAGVVLFVSLVLVTAAFFSWLSVHWRLPVVEEWLASIQERELRKTQAYVSDNLHLMATRLGELQARVIQLDSLGERLSGVVGLRRDGVAPSVKGGQGGPYLPASMTAGELQREIDSLSRSVEAQTDELSVLENRMMIKRVAARLLPTTLPVRNATLGSSFGHRTDPIAGLRAMHEGLDFSAEVGTPVMAAADGVVVLAEFHSEFGNMIDVDHGGGLVSRYAHLSRLDAKAGSLVKRGAVIGAVGNSGRSTGAHLHFEVRMLGVAQDPANFLRQGSEFAQLRRH